MIYKAAIISALAELMGVEKAFSLLDLQLKLGEPREIGSGISSSSQSYALEQFFCGKGIDTDQLIADCVGTTTSTGLLLHFAAPRNQNFIIVRTTQLAAG